MTEVPWKIDPEEWELTPVRSDSIQRGEYFLKTKTSKKVWLCESNRGSCRHNWESSYVDCYNKTYYLITGTKQTEEEKSTMNNKLYQVNGSETYANHIATNSQGLYVLEVKGTGEILTKDKSDLTEVFPYTVCVKYNDNGTLCHFLSKEGEVQKGDILYDLQTLGFARVKELDTKSEKATKDISGHFSRVMMEKL